MRRNRIPQYLALCAIVAVAGCATVESPPPAAAPQPAAPPVQAAAPPKAAPAPVVRVAGITKSCIRTGSGMPLGRQARPPFLKSPTNSFFFVSTEMVGCCRR